MCKTISIIVLAISMSGCGMFKAATGDYVEQAVVDKIKSDIEAKLEAHNLSIAQVTSALSDSEGHVTKQSVVIVAKESATEVALVEGKKLVDCEIKKLASKSDLDTESQRIFKWLAGAVLGMISTYLGKQLLAIRARAKKDSAFHDRITMLEQLTGLKILDDKMLKPPSPIPASTNTPEAPKAPPQAPVV
jgi:hypothetical protein